MVIGFDGSRAFVKNKTGTENYSYQLLKNLAILDKKNNYLIYLRPGIKPGESWPKNFQFKVINMHRFWTQIGLSKQTFKDPIEILFVPAHTLPLVYKKGLKTVVTVHDLGSEYLPKTHQLKQRIYLSFMQKYQLKTATKIIAVSEATKQDLISRVGIEPEKVKVVYEGYDKEKFKVKSKKEKSDIEGNSKSYFLFVGTVQPRKNLERIIQAFALLVNSSTGQLEKTRKQEDELRLVIAGSKGWLSDEIYMLPEKLGIKDKVKFLGYVPEKDLQGLYRGAKALVFPSLFEGFGLPILEAQACLCPVITSNTSSMSEVAGNSAILVNPYSIDDIVKGMERVNREGERRKLMKAGFENAKRFSWEKCAKETLEVFENLGKL